MSELHVELERTIEKLESANGSEPTHLDLTALKEFRKFCDLQVFGTNNSLERTVYFFLTKYLDEIFNNLFIDTTYTIDLHKSRIIIFQRIIEQLKDLKDALKQENIQNVVEILNLILQTYVQQIVNLNSLY